MSNKIMENPSKDIKALRTRRTHQEFIATRHLQALCNRIISLLSLSLFIPWSAVIWCTACPLWNPMWSDDTLSLYHAAVSVPEPTTPLPAVNWTVLGDACTQTQQNHFRPQFWFNGQRHKYHNEKSEHTLVATSERPSPLECSPILGF
jgi:hypothetical protein